MLFRSVHGQVERKELCRHGPARSRYNQPQDVDIGRNTQDDVDDVRRDKKVDEIFELSRDQLSDRVRGRKQSVVPSGCVHASYSTGAVW